MSSDKNPTEEVEELYLEPNPSEEEIQEQIRVIEMVNDAMDQAERTTQKLTHKGFASDSVVQDIVNYAYQLGGMDFVYVLECENGTYKLNSVGDSGHAHGLCQMNDRYHKDIPADYTTNRVVAVEYCYKKWSTGTRFYGPQRLVKGKKCYQYVADRFILE